MGRSRRALRPRALLRTLLRPKTLAALAILAGLAVVVGSRDAEKGARIAAEILADVPGATVTGTDNTSVAGRAGEAPVPAGCPGAPCGAVPPAATVPSMLILGSMRPSQAGMRQVASPRRLSVAGSSRQRTISASRKTALARLRPNSLITRSSPSMNDRNTQIMITAAALITRPVSAMPSAVARVASLWRTHSSRTREIRNTS